MARVLTWPAQVRQMPYRWWERWQAGLRDPWHALAGSRTLTSLLAVEAATGSTGPEEGVAALGATSDLRQLLVCGPMEANHNGGDVVLWSTDPATASRTLLRHDDHYDQAECALLTPDGAVAVVTTWEDRSVYAWRTATGERLWGDALGRDDDDDEFDDEEWAENDTLRASLSGDGTRVVFGDARGVRVVEVATGEVVFRSGDATGPAALDPTGARLAHIVDRSTCVLRVLPDGSVLSTADTGLDVVNAMAFAWDGNSLIAAGGVAVDTQEGKPVVRPIAAVVPIDGDRLGDIRRIRPTEQPERMVADSPLAAAATQLSWTQQGALVFAVDDVGAVLFDDTGRVLWSESGSVTGTLTPDGRTLLIAGESDIEAWFVNAIGPPIAVG